MHRTCVSWLEVNTSDHRAVGIDEAKFPRRHQILVRSMVLVIVEIRGHRGGCVDDAECHVIVVVWFPLEIIVGLDDCFALLIMACYEAVELWEVGELAGGGF